MNKYLFTFTAALLLIGYGISFAADDAANVTDTLKIEIDCLSGIENPYFTIDLNESSELSQLLNSLVNEVNRNDLSALPLDKEYKYPKSGYRGIRVSDPGGNILPDGTYITITKKYIRVSAGDDTRYFSNNSYKKLEKEAMKRAIKGGLLGEKALDDVI